MSSIHESFTSVFILKYIMTNSPAAVIDLYHYSLFIFFIIINKDETSITGPSACIYYVLKLFKLNCTI